MLGQCYLNLGLMGRRHSDINPAANHHLSPNNSYGYRAHRFRLLNVMLPWCVRATIKYLECSAELRDSKSNFKGKWLCRCWAQWTMCACGQWMYFRQKHHQPLFYSTLLIKLTRKIWKKTTLNLGDCTTMLLLSTHAGCADHNIVLPWALNIHLSCEVIILPVIKVFSHPPLMSAGINLCSGRVKFKGCNEERDSVLLHTHVMTLWWSLMIACLEE